MDTRHFDLSAYERFVGLVPMLLAEESPGPLLCALADGVEELIPCSALVLYELREDDGALVPLVIRGFLPGERLLPFVPDASSIEALVLSASRTLETARSELVSAALQQESEIEAVAAGPLVARGQTRGCLVVRRSGPGRLFSSDELQFLSRFADVAAIALDNARTRAHFEDLAQTDGLTGLLNRRGFFAALDRALAQAQRTTDETSLLSLDVDGLKLINDRFGHSVGDAVLVRVAQTLAAQTRRGDVVGRLGGDEFAVVLTSTRASAAARIRRDLNAALAGARVQTPEGAIAPRASFGLASTRGETMTAEQLFAQSDSDMYLTKRHRQRNASPPSNPSANDAPEPGAFAASEGHEATCGAPPYP